MNTKDHILQDSFARQITYLRVSLTDHCNFRCSYCKPRGVENKLERSQLLSYEELIRIITIAVGIGIKKIRLTGGEPLLRRNILEFIRQLVAIPGLEDIRITTNGSLLPEMAANLYALGIRKVNISLDTLRRDRFKEITGVQAFDRVYDAINQVIALGFDPIKINVVAMRGVNDDELVDFSELTRSRKIQVRFIEFMPVGAQSSWDKKFYLPTEEIRQTIERGGQLEAIPSQQIDGPARVYRLPGATGTIGFISPLSEHFCDRCNRLRLTSEGKLRSCLLTDQETDLRSLLRAGCKDEKIIELLIKTIHDKPKGHLLGRDGGSCHGQMSRIGG
ncbi:MAG: GTP 3',8-cyclase MoaA [Proteobacteria bacterium]|nr:GTP 3',8-cyclase MoaA [Pseudomonadota bacterium]MBU1686510.1 GTP 3',8-cyclase MoaA [Pseudomonadota bacterium]